MALKADNNQSNIKRVEQPIIEADVYPARLVQVVELGLQAQRPYKGAEKAPTNEIMLTYELVDVFMVDEEGNELEDKPRWVSEFMPFYGLGADNARSTKRYLAFDPDKKFDGDFSKIIGMPCNITIVNNVKDGKTYINVANVASMSAKKAANVAELKNEPKVFDLDAPDLATFQSFPQFLQEKIKNNLHFKGSKLEAILSGVGIPEPKKEPVKKEAPKQEEDDNEDNPF